MIFHASVSPIGVQRFDCTLQLASAGNARTTTIPTVEAAV
jgi:hypothetical protein